MTDIAITAANVVPGANAVTVQGAAGETVTAGQLGYKSSTTNKWMKADSNSATVEARTPQGVFLNGAALNQPVIVQRSGDITIGATLVANTPYAASDTPGGICPLADVGAGEYFTEVGIARTTAILQLGFISTGVAN